jgi:hypothetical protein
MKTTISKQKGITNEAAEEILSAAGFPMAGLVIYFLTYNRTGYGHYKLEVELCNYFNFAESVYLSRTSTDASLIDDWDEDFPLHHDRPQEDALLFILTLDENREALLSFINYKTKTNSGIQGVPLSNY